MTVPKHVRQARQAMIDGFNEKLAGELFSHTAIFARTPLRWGEPPGSGIEFLQGSGTLVQVDTEDGETRFGGLTCGHVLEAFDEGWEGARNDSLTLLVPNNGPRGENPPWSTTMPYPRATAVIEGGAYEKGTMPDLAWWPLTAEEAGRLRDRRGSGVEFYNLNKGLKKYGTWEQNLKAVGGLSENEIVSDNLFVAVGWNQQIHGRTRGRRGGIWMTEVIPECLYEHKGWEYANYRINDKEWSRRTYDDGNVLASRWHGLSGGGIWHIWRSDPGSESFEKVLCGVPFHQIPHRDGRTMSIRAHHGTSLLRILHHAQSAPRGAPSEDEIVTAVQTISTSAPTNAG